ncbi:MAG: hypothetical protein ACI9Y7_000190 [Dokdonia sp.]|jgi:hypothetical protein
MTSNVSLLFSIGVEHTYYADGICKDLQYTPSLETQKLMNRYSLYLQTIPEGFSFYTTTDQSITDFLKYIKTTDDATSFSFDVTSMNQDFTVFTDYPITSVGAFYFDSVNTTIIGGSTVLNGVFEPSSMSLVSFTITIDYDAIIRFRESGNNPRYSIQFTSRKTQWRYYIINNSNQHFEKLEIQSNSDIQFEDPIEVTLPNNTIALLFSSGSVKIPLEENPTHTFNLVATKTSLGNTRTQVIIQGLPIAKSNSIETYTEGDTTYVASPLYIYI